jgi:uncharacterized membrane protein YciS (DUF1049 family)
MDRRPAASRTICHNSVVNLPLLAASDYGLAVAIAFLFVLFLIVGWVIVQGTRAQLEWRRLVDSGDISAITTLVSDELTRWKTIRMPKGMQPSIWHGVQSAEFVEATPEGVRISATSEAQYATVDGQRQETSSPFNEARKVTAKLADMVLYDIPNVKLPYVQVDIYITYRTDAESTQRCVLSTICKREIADVLAWEEMDAEEVVTAFGGRYVLDDRGNPLAVDPGATGRTAGVPAVFYKDD